jgi:hypothetical protein
LLAKPLESSFPALIRLDYNGVEQGSSPPKETKMRRHRLTFDANPKELASRETGVADVVLLWSRRSNRAAVVVEDDATGAVSEMEVREGENALDLFEHALAYLPIRSRPGRLPFGDPDPLAAA